MVIGKLLSTNHEIFCLLVLLIRREIVNKQNKICCFWRLLKVTNGFVIVE